MFNADASTTVLVALFALALTILFAGMVSAAYAFFKRTDSPKNRKFNAISITCSMTAIGIFIIIMLLKYTVFKL